jgi:pterin-4a-carbinolamine dehydratase
MMVPLNETISLKTLKTLNTHDVGGITGNDFKLAESIENIVNS